MYPAKTSRPFVDAFRPGLLALAVVGLALVVGVQVLGRIPGIARRLPGALVLVGCLFFLRLEVLREVHATGDVPNVGGGEHGGS